MSIMLKDQTVAFIINHNGMELGWRTRAERREGGYDKKKIVETKTWTCLDEFLHKHF